MSIKIGHRFIILQPSEAIDSDERIPITLGPGKAFGSGEHETTRSCLEEMESIPVFPGAKVLDLGCGTGILSIAAAKMGAHSVMALDPDPDAIKTTTANIALNKVENIVLPQLGELGTVKHERFDLILANLYGDILLKLVPDLPLCLNPGGYLLLSGIQYEYAFELKTGIMKAGLKILKSSYLEEFCTLLFKKLP